MKDATHCVVCNANSWRGVFTRLGYNFIKCTNCRLIRMESIPSLEDISRHYNKKFVNGNYELARRYDSDYKMIYSQFLDFILPYTRCLQGRNLLDIGCYTGQFLDVALQSGFVTYGVEYQNEAAQIANKQHGGRVYSGSIEGYTRPSNIYFDIVTASGVIEHVCMPDRLIEIASNLLKQGGLFVIQTPNTDSIPARLLGKYWPPFAPIEHIFYFSSRNIRTLLERYGFRVIKVKSHWKRLPVGYVYNNLQSFGPECYKIMSNIMPLLPSSVLSWRLPFYGGEMILIVEKL